MDTKHTKHIKEIKLFDGRTLRFDKTSIMGILNVNDDSFYEGSRVSSVEYAVVRAVRMVEDGADILDIGAESTRPGSAGMAAGEELRALIPAIDAVRRELPGIPISADTRKASVAKAALDAGADIINDVSGLELQGEAEEMMRLVADSGCAYVLMHTKGTPDTMQMAPRYDDFLTELRLFFAEKLDRLLSAGVAREKIFADPGIGFGKRVRDNIDILANIPYLMEIGFPLLIGASRKAFIGRISKTEQKTPPEERLYGTLAVTAICAYEGVEVVRVHDVAENAEAARLARAVGERRSG